MCIRDRFNILSYMSDRLLTIGNTTAALDELYAVSYTHLPMVAGVLGMAWR